MDQEKLKRVLKDFSQLSKAEKQKRVVLWVKSENPKVIPVLQSIASQDTEVQIRYLARKGAFHLNRRLGELKGASREYKDFQEIEAELLKGFTPETGQLLEAGIDSFPDETCQFILDAFQSEQDPYMLSTLLLSLGKIGNQECLKDILNFLEHEDSRVRASAVEAMGLLSCTEATPYLVRSLRDSDNRIRANAIRALKVQGRKPVFEAMRQMAESGEVWMRNSAAFAIGEYKSEEALEVLAGLLNDENQSVGKMAYRSLNKLSEAGVIKARTLLEKLSDLKTPESILDFLGLMDGGKEGKEENQLFSEDSRKRLMEINRIVTEQQEDRYRELEERLVVEEDNFVRASLILALGRVSQESSVNLIKSFLNSPVPRLRANAIEALASFEKMEYLPEVLLRLQDSNNRARANAILALSKMPYVDVITPLRDMASSIEILQQQSAFYVITELPSPETLQILVDLSQSCEDRNLLQNIRDQLEMLQEEYEEARNPLERLKTKLGEELPPEEKESEEELAREDLSPGLSEADFEGFLPDDLERTDVEKVEMEDFLKSSPEKKVLFIEFMKENPTQEHYTILRLAERDRDFQVKCLARIAVGPYKSLNFEEENLDGLEIGKDGSLTKNAHAFLPGLGIDRRKVQYEGESTIHQLNMELQRRAQAHQQGIPWQGRFGESFPMLSALRMDTQEMICTVLGEEQLNLKHCGLCFFSPTYKPYLEGIKTLDGINYENFIQLNTLKTSLLDMENPDPVSEMITAVAAPKYLLVLVSAESLVLFLRYTLAYRRAEYVRIPLKQVLSAAIKKEENKNDLVLELKDKHSLVLPGLHMPNAQALLNSIQTN